MDDPDAPPLNTETLIAALDQCGVQYVIVGGIGAIIHGANTATFDFDVVPATSPENLAALAKALISLGAKLRLEDGTTVEMPIDRVSLGQFELSTWRTDAGDIDIIRGIPTANGLTELRFYSELAAAGDQVEVFGATVVVASLAMIIESKEGAGRAVDDQALPHLREIQKSIESDIDCGL